MLFNILPFSPTALITPAKSHGEVIVAAVAARDRSRAETYAKKHGIPIVHSSYEGRNPKFLGDTEKFQQVC